MYTRTAGVGRWIGHPPSLGSDSIYGESIATQRWELIGQYQLPMPGTVMLQFSQRAPAGKLVRYHAL
jgi:hypothetical protein